MFIRNPPLKMMEVDLNITTGIDVTHRKPPDMVLLLSFPGSGPPVTEERLR